MNPRALRILTLSASLASAVALLGCGGGAGSGSPTEELGSTPSTDGPGTTPSTDAPGTTTPPTAASGAVAWLAADVPSALPADFKSHVDAYYEHVKTLQGVTVHREEPPEDGPGEGIPVIVRWTHAPVVVVDPSNTIWTADVVREAVAHFRAILPAEMRPVFGGVADAERKGTIWITEAWTTPILRALPGYAKIQWGGPNPLLSEGRGEIESVMIDLNRLPYPTRTDADAARTRSAAGRADTLIHELYHAMALASDIYDPEIGEQFPDGRLNNTVSRNPHAKRFGLVDVGALIKHYQPTEWGEWAGDVGGVQGTVAALSFYTRTFGPAIAIPGYHGVAPTGQAPSMSATWTGGLAGIAGGIRVNGTSRLHWTGADLDALFTWGTSRAEYDLTMTAQGAFHDDRSEVFGRVLGSAGEYVGGTITRTDLTGAFGGQRG